MKNSNTGSTLKEVLEQKGIKYVCFDLDGTLLSTDTWFDDHILKLCSLLMNNPPQKEDFNKVLRIIKFYKPTYQVHPKLMTTTCRTAARAAGVEPNQKEYHQAMALMARIYGPEVPELIPGSLKTLSIFKKTELPLMLITHAGEEWTQLKIRGRNIAHYFEDVVCLDVMQTKQKQWRDAFEKLNIDPKNALIVGDNLKADIHPVLNLGAWAAWIKRPNNGWKDLPKNKMKNKSKLLVSKSIGSFPSDLLQAWG